MTNRSDPDAATAMQYLVWALEYIEKTGDLKALHHARLALKALRERARSPADHISFIGLPSDCWVEVNTHAFVDLNQSQPTLLPTSMRHEPAR